MGISKYYYVFDFRDTLKFKYLSSILYELNLYVVHPFFWAAYLSHLTLLYIIVYIIVNLVLLYSTPYPYMMLLYHFLSHFLYYHYFFLVYHAVINKSIFYFSKK